jgi:hypothetical protein
MKIQILPHGVSFVTSLISALFFGQMTFHFYKNFKPICRDLSTFTKAQKSQSFSVKMTWKRYQNDRFEIFYKMVCQFFEKKSFEISDVSKFSKRDTTVIIMINK